MNSKRRGIITLAIAVILTAVFIFTAVSGWGSNAAGAMKNIKTGLDLSGGVSITYEANEAAPSAADMADTIYKLQRRIDQYSTEANVYQEGLNRINVEIPGVTDADAILTELGTPGSLYFIAETSDGEMNYNLVDYAKGEYELNGTIEEIQARGGIVCTGADVADAQGVVDSSDAKGNKYEVALEFTSDATQRFAEATKKAYESGETIGIYYDGSFVSVPSVSSVISNGRAVIQGMSSIEAAQNLASYIRIGGLSLTLNEIRSNVVGAQLGQEALRTSLIGGVIGLGIVCLIMILVYLLPGFIATLMLAAYAAILLVLINAFDLTLTLPGIAGIILSIGMAVDANVIIYARIREEIASGASVAAAIRAGFSKAMSSILDGNITTLIAAAVLGVLGTGTIKGFAMTLAIGVALSLFTACIASRFVVQAFYAIGFRDEKYWTRKVRETRYDFIGRRKISFIIAAVAIAAGIIAMIGHAAAGNRMLNFSLEFLGGTSTNVRFEEDYTLQEIDDTIKPVIVEITGDASVSAQKVVNSNEVIFKTRTLTADERLKMSDAFVEKFNVDKGSITTENISATVGKEMRNAAILAVVIAVALMLLYIFIRFRDIRFATAAILALIHDILVVLAAYAILRISVGNSFIAVMLTILGYSINSTIVIFDRIRERLRAGARDAGLRDLVNTSINQTLTRSIFTNLTTFASIFVLYIIGVSTIKDFTLPMLVGIVAGTFSSVFLTGVMWYLMRKGKKGVQADAEAAAIAAAAPEVREQIEKEKEIRKGPNPNVIRKKKKK